MKLKEDFKENFFSYRDDVHFRGLQETNRLTRFASIPGIVRRAEKQLLVCFADDVIDFAYEIEGILILHQEAITSESTTEDIELSAAEDFSSTSVQKLKSAYRFFTQRSQSGADSLALWGCRFAVLSLVKVAEALEARSASFAADAALEAMDAVGFSELIETQWSEGRTREELNLARARLLESERAAKSAELERRNVLIHAGAAGGQSRAAKFAPLKEWTVKEARKRKGSPTEIARNLLRILPDSLKDLEIKDYPRLMAEAIRADRKANS